MKMISLPLIVSPSEWEKNHPISLRSIGRPLSIVLGPQEIFGGAGQARAVIFCGDGVADGTFIFQPEPFDHPAWMPLYQRHFQGAVITPSQASIPFEWPTHRLSYGIPEHGGFPALTYELNFEFKTASEFVKDLVETLSDLLSTAEEAVLLAAGEVAAVSIGRVGMN
jgi:hypothetical protein